MLELAPHNIHVSLLPHLFHIAGWEPLAKGASGHAAMTVMR